MECQLDHVAINIENDDDMLSFYRDVLMLEPLRIDQYWADQVSFPSFRLNEHTIIDLFPKTLWSNNASDRPHGSVHLNHFCLSLSKSDWQDLVNRLKLKNIPIEEGPVSRWGARGNGTSVYFRDPESNLIEAKYYEAV